MARVAPLLLISITRYLVHGTSSDTLLATSQDLLKSLHAKAVDEERAITELLERFDCKHVYLDCGSNIGVQIRKLCIPLSTDSNPGAWSLFRRSCSQSDQRSFRISRGADEPSLYPDAARGAALPRFAAAFGPAPRCDVCSIGIEANPRHRPRLETLASTYQAAGAGVLMLSAAVSDADGVNSLFDFNRTDHWIAMHGGKDLQVIAGIPDSSRGAANIASDATDRATIVRTVDLARVLHTINRALVTRNSEKHGAGGAAHLRNESKIVMKMDIEGAEHRVLPHLLHMGALCLVDRLYGEWHGTTMKGWLDDALRKSPCGGTSRGKALLADLAPYRLDDESHRRDGMRWPQSRSLCPDRVKP